MNKLTATYRVVTPMFLGGADPTAEAELRVPSFKGALRFWWRALMWGKVSDVGELRRKEAELFGSSDSGIGQSKFLLRIETSASATTLSRGDVLGRTGGKGAQGPSVVGEGARYLGYGLIGGRLIRSCAAASFEFKVHLRFKRDLSPEGTQHILNALKLLGLCSGLGSRSRRGFGSLTLTKLHGTEQNDWRPPVTPEEWESSVRAILGEMRPRQALPEWTSFASGQSRALVVRGGQETPLELLARLGRDFVFFRSWGNIGKVLGLPREGNFKDDHDLMEAPVYQRQHHPRRIVFGLPHNYGKAADEQVGPADSELDRRASPLFVHIHQSSSAIPPLGVLLFLPSRFLPPNRDRISVGGAKVLLAHQGIGDFWRPVHEFLERLQNGKGKEQFLQPRLICL